MCLRDIIVMLLVRMMLKDTTLEMFVYVVEGFRCDAGG